MCQFNQLLGSHAFYGFEIRLVANAFCRSLVYRIFPFLPTDLKYTIDFLETLLKRCRQEGIHTAVDTAGLVPWESFERILPYTNLFLYDVKCYSEQLHREGTGVSNVTILENLKKLSEAQDFKGEIFIRIPVIPGYNMSDEEMQQIAGFLKGIRHSKVELLGYHKLGENKYAAIDKELTQFSVPATEEIKRLEELFS